MKITISFILITCISVINAIASDISEGFQLLETGRFTEAKAFFAAYLVSDPDDRTARLCLGRATGLSGNPEEALEIFRALEADHPEGGSMELSLNIAEAYLWNENLPAALTIYQALLQMDSTKLEVCLGYANTLCGLSRFDEALPFIRRALILDSGEQARTSWKYINLGLQDQYKSQGQTKRAHAVLDTLERWYPNDPLLIQARAAVYLTEKEFRKARASYRKILSDSICGLEAHIGMAYAHMVLQRTSAGLRYARAAVTMLDGRTDALMRERVYTNYIYLLGANRKYRMASDLLDSLMMEYPQSIAFHQAKARLSLWRQKPEAAQEVMDTLLQCYPVNYETLLGSAEVEAAIKNEQIALALLDSAQAVAPARREAGELTDRILSGRRGSVAASSTVMRDNGGNESITSEWRLEPGTFGAFRPFVAAGVKSARFRNTLDGEHTYRIAAGLEWTSGYRLRIHASGGVSKVASADSRLQWLMDAEVKYRTRRSHQIGFRIIQSVYDYNAELIRSHIYTTNIQADYHKSFPLGTGLYGAAGYGHFSDQNSKFWTFSSLYHQFHPMVKAGANYQEVHFAKPDVPDYFSPSGYRSAEGFIRFEIKDYNVRPVSFFADVATGGQCTKTGGWDLHYRFETGLGWSSQRGTLLETTFKGSSSAYNESSGGYTFYSISFKVQYSFKKQWFGKEMAR